LKVQNIWGNCFVTQLPSFFRINKAWLTQEYFGNILNGLIGKVN
jgi:hypothetical protein